MASLDDLKKRITSVKSTQKITKAMKMVAAAKLRKAQENAEKGRPYSEKMNNIIINLSNGISDKASAPELLIGTGEEKNHLCVVMTSDRGLCGGFNSNIIKQTKSLVNNEYKDCKSSIISIGKKSSEYFNKNRFVVAETYDDLYNEITFERVSEIAESIMNDFIAEKYDKVVLVYNQFKNAATQIVMKENFLPVEPPKDEMVNIGDYIFEPSKEKIVHQLIPKSLKTQMFKAILDSYASEHGARMTAMHKATDNANDLKDDLTLFYNKARQAAITGEILEIVGGAEALNG